MWRPTACRNIESERGAADTIDEIDTVGTSMGTQEEAVRTDARKSWMQTYLSETHGPRMKLLEAERDLDREHPPPYMTDEEEEALDVHKKAREYIDGYYGKVRKGVKRKAVPLEPAEKKVDGWVDGEDNEPGFLKVVGLPKEPDSADSRVVRAVLKGMGKGWNKIAFIEKIIKDGMPIEWDPEKEVEAAHVPTKEVERIVLAAAGWTREHGRGRMLIHYSDGASVETSFYKNMKDNPFVMKEEDSQRKVMEKRAEETFLYKNMKDNPFVMKEEASERKVMKEEDALDRDEVMNEEVEASQAI